MLRDVECAKKVLNRYRSIQPFGGSPLLGESVFGVVSCMQNSLKECMRGLRGFEDDERIPSPFKDVFREYLGAVS